MASEYVRYLKKLYKEYCNSIGVFSIDYRRMFDNLAFRMWLKEYKNKLKYYRRCLFETGILSENIILELEKGYYDTVTRPENTTHILTEYSKSFNDSSNLYNYNDKVDNRRVIKGDLTPYDKGSENESGIVIHLRNTERIINLLSGPDRSSYVVAHNPYNSKLVTNNLGLAYDNGFAISFGIHGLMSDQDRGKKLKTFENVTKTLEFPSSEIEYYKEGNNYAYVAKKR